MKAAAARVLFALLLPLVALAQTEQPDPFAAFYGTGYTPGESPTYPTLEIEEIETQGAGLLDFRAVENPLAWARRQRDVLFDQTGLRFAAFYTALFQQATDGPGYLTGASGDLDLLASWTFVGRNTENFGQIVFDAEYRHAIGYQPASALRTGIGSLQGTTNAFNDREWAIRNLHYVQRVFDGRLRFLIGRADPSDFAGAHAMQNLNTMFSNRAFSSASTVPFPGHGFAAGASVRPVPWFYATLGASNAYGNAITNDLPVLDYADFFAFVETGLTPEIPRLGNGRYRFFLWNMDARSGLGVPQDSGYSIILDQELGRHFQVFFRHGYADEAITGIRRSTEAGVGYRDFFNVSGNLAGVAFAWSEPASGRPPEKILEGFVRLQLTSVLQASAGVQGIFAPPNSPDNATAVFTGRVRLAF